MTELEALKLVWNMAGFAVTAGSPKGKEALSAVSELIEKVDKAEVDEIAKLLLTEDVMGDAGWVPVEFASVGGVRESLEKLGAENMAATLSNEAIIKALRDSRDVPGRRRTLRNLCRNIEAAAARALYKAQVKVWPEPRDEED